MSVGLGGPLASFRLGMISERRPAIAVTAGLLLEDDSRTELQSR
jgi:hypothetical protein